MLHTMESSGQPHNISPSNSSPINFKSGRRKPLQILTEIFTRKSPREMSETSETKDNNFYLADDTDVDVDMWDSLSEADGIPEPREALHSPYHAKTIDQDMQNLRLSRQDNPFLQVLASRECLNESDDGSEYEEKNLMSKENVSGDSHDPELSLEEVHARLVRSPPPVMWTRSRNSEPSFSHLTSPHTTSLGGADFVFQFPPREAPNLRIVSMEPSPTHSCRSHASSLPQGHGRFLGPFRKENTLELLSGKFNLSPQPRRRPPNLKSRPFSDFSTSS